MISIESSISEQNTIMSLQHHLQLTCPSQRRTTFAEAVESEFANSVIDGIPKLGMGFDSEDVAVL